MKTAPVWFAVALLLVATGCASSGSTSPDPGTDSTQEGRLHAPTPAPSAGARASSGRVSEDDFRVFRGTYEVSEEFKSAPPASVAVLPFSEQGSWSVAPDGLTPREIVRRGMYNHLASLPFRDLEPSRVDARLAQEGLTSPEALRQIIHTDPARLKQILGVDAVVTGVVTNFDRVYLGVYSEVRVGCELRMYSLNTGSQLWYAEHQSASASGGVSIDPISMAMTALSTLWNLREDEFYTQTDDLFREIASTLERELDPALVALGPPPPPIDLFVCLNADRPFATGDAIAFRLVGEPGCKASVLLDNHPAAIQMSPVSEQIKAEIWAQTLAMVRQHYVETGHVPTTEMLEAIHAEFLTREIYQGEYVVSPGEEEQGLTATARLEQPGGSRSEALYAEHPIVIDTLAPAAPVNVAQKDSATGPVLTWTPNMESDVVGYEVHGNDSPLGELHPLAVVETNQVAMRDLAAHGMTNYRVRAVDSAGNRGPFSQTGGYSDVTDISVAPLAAAPAATPAVLGGVLDQDMHLTADSGPYVMQEDLHVVPGGVLRVDPGVTVRMSPGTTLYVAGGDILAQGSADAPVRFVPLEQGAGPGSHGGLNLDSPGRAELRHVVVEYATVGVAVTGGEARLTSVDVSGSSQAGILLGQDSRPVIENCRIENNQGMGGLVVEGTGVAPLIRGNTFVNNAPFQVQCYTESQIDLRGNDWGQADPPLEWFLGNVLLDDSADAPAPSLAREDTAL